MVSVGLVNTCGRFLREILVGIVVIPGCGDIPGWMLRGVDGECHVGWDSVRSRGVGRCEVSVGTLH